MRILRLILFLAGIILLTNNLYGLFRSLRNPEIYTEKSTEMLNDVTIRLEDAKKALIRQPDETDKDFALRVNEIVNKSMSHYWLDEGITKYHLRVPVWENYILYLQHSFRENRKYEFIDYHKGLERGVGLCSTHALVLKGILTENGIEAQLWDISGHSILRTKVAEDEWYILDPDYGLFIPYDTDEIESNPELVRPVYQNVASIYKPGYTGPYTTDHIVKLYGKAGNHFFNYNPDFENRTYKAIWIIPLLLMIPFGTSILKKRIN